MEVFSARGLPDVRNSSVSKLAYMNVGLVAICKSNRDRRNSNDG
jgi:hypothetical protein